MQTSTPKEITKHIRQLIAKVTPGREPMYLPVRPTDGAEVNECFPNVEAKIALAGGRMLCGWQFGSGLTS